MLLGRKYVLAAKVEPEEGTPETLTGSECIRVYDLTWTPNVEMLERPIGRSTIGQGLKLVGRSSAQMAFKVEFIGNHAAGTEPEWDPLIQSCAFALTAGASDITYKPTSVLENVPSVTLGGWIDGTYREIAGARGNVQLMLPVGRMPYLQFTFTGAAWNVSDVVNPVPVFDTSVPLPFLAVTFAMDGVAMLIDQLSINMQNTVALRSDQAQQCGYRSSRITMRDPVMTFDPEMAKVTTGADAYDFYGKWKAGTPGALSAVWGTRPGR